jgi:CRISPR/Cas system CSM-associated protein Csm3 (group 7 of RAMP superfamily)
MSRHIAARLKIKGELVADGPLHVGGMGGNPDVDLALAVDGKNRCYIPGTSLAGPLRDWVERRLGKGDELFGPQMIRGKDDEGFASFILVEDAIVRGTEAIEIRDGVGINRFTGAAAEGIKYDRAVLPNGSRFDFNMTVEIKNAEQKEYIKKLTGSLLHALARGEIRFGAARTRGLGRLRLAENADGPKIYEHELLSPAGIIALLRRSQHAQTLADLGQADLRCQPSLDVEITWQPKGALMVKAEREGLGVDMLPLTSLIEDHLAFVLPGSSIKGAVRAQAERIARTVRGFSAPSKGNPRQLFLDQVGMRHADSDGTAIPGDGDAAAGLIGALFGVAAKRGDRPSRKGDNTPRPGRGAVAVADCYAKTRFSLEQWTNVEQAQSDIEQGKNESRLHEALVDAGLTHDPPTKESYSQMAMHVAIDRWTGGAADKFLYSVLEPHGIDWEPIRLSLDLTRLRKDEEHNDRDPAVALLLLVLRDLSAGRIPLGFGVNRGMGAIDVNAITFTPEGLDHDDTLNCLKDVKIENGRITGFSDDLNNAWVKWANAESPQPPATGEKK